MSIFQIFRVLAITTLLLALAACGGSSEGGGDAAADAGGDAAGGDGAAAAVTIADLAYSPAEIEVASGGTVTWTNDDEAPHTVTFDDDSVASSEEMNTGDEFSATFDAAGSYSYVCAIHPDMKGTVTVQ